MKTSNYEEIAVFGLTLDPKIREPEVDAIVSLEDFNICYWNTSLEQTKSSYDMAPDGQSKSVLKFVVSCDPRELLLNHIRGLPVGVDFEVKYGGLIYTSGATFDK